MFKSLRLRFIFVSIVLILLLSPLLQLKLRVLPEITLNGAQTKVPLPSFSLQSFLSGEMQKNVEMWIEQNLSLKSYFVKTNNQIFYSLFNQTPPNSSIIVGKSGQLYEKVYIDEYLSVIPPLSPSLLEGKVIKLKRIQEQLSLEGKTFVLLITPSKASIYPEHIPDRLIKSGRALERNYDILVPLLNKHGINYIDGHKISMDHKNDGAPLFPKGGVHWNYLGAYYTVKEFIEEINELSSKKLMNIELNSIVEDIPTGTNRDLADLLNLWRVPLNYSVPSPILESNEINENYGKPSILIEGGSFSYQFIELLNSQNLFSTLDFYYYYNTHFTYLEGKPNSNHKGELISIDWKNDVMSHDIIIVEMNEERVAKLNDSRGFIEDSYSYLNPIDLRFSHQFEYTEKTQFNKKEGYILKKKAPGEGTVFLESDPLDLEPNQTYTLSFKAKGFRYLNVDLFPDDLPQQNYDNITNQFKEYTFTFTSDSINMRNSRVRFFIDGLSISTSMNSYLYDIKLTKNTKIK